MSITGGPYLEVRSALQGQATEADPLVPAFLPGLAVLLQALESKKGSALTESEVLRTRDEAPCIAMRRSDGALLAETRGRDIDPENVWEEWCSKR